jgi:hypothetical protein
MKRMNRRAMMKSDERRVDDGEEVKDEVQGEDGESDADIEGSN